MTLLEQLTALAWITGTGFLGGFLYDFYRAFCRVMRFKRVSIFVGDLCFWLFLTIVAGGLLILINQGEMRFYVLLGLILGAMFYFKFCSRVSYTLIYKFLQLISRGPGVFIRAIKRLCRNIFIF
jgi:spore cortex biosynthesis protein YabQ